MEKLRFDDIDIEFAASLYCSDDPDEALFPLLDHYTSLYDTYVEENNPQGHEKQVMDASYFSMWHIVAKVCPNYLTEIAERYEGTKMMQMIRFYNRKFKRMNDPTMVLNLDEVKPNERS